MILDYSRGALDAGRRRVLATHVGVCAECQADLARAEAVGGALLAELEPAEMAADALQQALARIETPPNPSSEAPRPRADWIAVPPDVLVAAERRKRWAAPGVWVAPISRDRRTGARSYLLGVGAGIAIPRHTHRGDELVCVLKGAFEDGDQVYRPGDLAVSDDDIEHEPRVTRDGDCVCLVATDGPLVPRSLMARLFQPIVRI
jgi:putative transcriptional regulator